MQKTGLSNEINNEKSSEGKATANGVITDRDQKTKKLSFYCPASGIQIEKSLFDNARLQKDTQQRRWHLKKNRKIYASGSKANKLIFIDNEEYNIFGPSSFEDRQNRKTVNDASIMEIMRQRTRTLFCRALNMWKCTATRKLNVPVILEPYFNCISKKRPKFNRESVVLPWGWKAVFRQSFEHFF